MNVTPSDVNNLVFKSQMVGASQNLRTDQTVKETDKSRDIEKARDANPEATEQDSFSVNSNGAAVRVTPRKQTRQEGRNLGRLEQGEADWSQEPKQGDEWLPPSLRPQSRTAGPSSQYNVPYWLMEPKNEQASSQSPQAAHRKLLNGLRNIVNIEIQQYIKANEPPYAKKTLREIATVLSDDSSMSPKPPQGNTMAGTQPGLNASNWGRASNTLDLVENPQTYPGEGLELVA